jgi:DNA polymerase III gamma/tau subunit
MRVACFCGAVYDADPPVGFCPHCDAAPVICPSGAADSSDLEAAYNEAVDAIRDLPEAA